MRLTTRVVAAAAMHFGATAAANESSAVRVHFVHAPVDTATVSFAVSPGQITVVEDLEFDLSISLEGSEVEFLRDGVVVSHMTVERQFETSVSIMDDGPHLDLLDWTHYTSEWLEISVSETGQIVLPVFTPDEQSRFPEVDSAELREAVHSAGGERWSRLIDDSSGVRDPNVGIGVSRIRLRFTDESDANETRWYVIELPFPMGC